MRLGSTPRALCTAGPFSLTISYNHAQVRDCPGYLLPPMHSQTMPSRKCNVTQGRGFTRVKWLEARENKVGCGLWPHRWYIVRWAATRPATCEHQRVCVMSNTICIETQASCTCGKVLMVPDKAGASMSRPHSSPAPSVIPPKHGSNVKGGRAHFFSMLSGVMGSPSRRGASAPPTSP